MYSLRTIAKLLYIAMAYGSRTTRIRAMLNSSDPDVEILARALKYAGYLNEVDGTVIKDPI